MESESGVRGYPVELVFLAAVNMRRPPEKWGDRAAARDEADPLTYSAGVVLTQKEEGKTKKEWRGTARKPCATDRLSSGAYRLPPRTYQLVSANGG
jgi:hypothetical protein